MLVVECEGSPYEIGHHHGAAASAAIHRSISFYASLFLQNCGQDWPSVLRHAQAFEQVARAKWPALHDEMRGIAAGSGVSLLDIVAINVRTEINFGMFSEGCTALAWHEGGKAFLAQNWDWLPAQHPNLLLLRITSPSHPQILTLTEAGLLSKIGFNSSGLGVALNAIRIPGVSPSHLPVHFALRLALSSRSVASAISTLESYGVASSAHILLADAASAVGLECTKSTFWRVMPDARGRVLHANHMVGEHPGEKDTEWLGDSRGRVGRMGELVGELAGRLDGGEEEAGLGFENVGRLFEDVVGDPVGICRRGTEGGSQTLFNIVMDLKEKRAVVRLGRPSEEGGERVVLEF